MIFAGKAVELEEICVILQAYSERKQALTSTNHHLENKEPKIKTIKSVCALCADVSMDSLGLW